MKSKLEVSRSKIRLP